MNRNIVTAIFSWSGASIAIGLLGFIAAVVSLFVDVNANISVKWLILVVLVLVSLILIFLKLINDLSQVSIPVRPFEVPIRFYRDEQLFVIRRNENFVNNIIVGCYVNQDDIDRLAYIGVVHLVQDKVIQIQVRYDLKVLDKFPSSTNDLKNLVVRPVVPVTALRHIQSMEANSE